MLNILRKRIKDNKTLWLLEEVIESFITGLPIGNLTSQLFANIYLNEFDQFVKHKLKIKHYLRYTDDFIIVANSESCLKNLINPIQSFLKNKLALSLQHK